VGVLLADVSGHGVSAALHTGMVKSEMQAVREEHARPEALFERINTRLCAVTRGRFVTALLLVLDLEARSVRYVSAGHPSFLTGDGRAWESTGPPLGLLADGTYEVGEVPFGPGDRLLLYTDGLSEAMRDDGSDFGLDRIREVFLGAAALPRDRAVDAVVEAARAFTGRPRFADDAAVVLLEHAP
jgi:sigma-B regulation protein RsbU (phosphoserine phosphatase)